MFGIASRTEFGQEFTESKHFETFAEAQAWLDAKDAEFDSDQNNPSLRTSGFFRPSRWSRVIHLET